MGLCVYGLWSMIVHFTSTEEEQLLDGSEAELGLLRTPNWGSQAVLG